jgi:hypothetical protein
MNKDNLIIAFGIFAGAFITCFFIVSLIQGYIKKDVENFKKQIYIEQRQYMIKNSQ